MNLALGLHFDNQLNTSTSIDILIILSNEKDGHIFFQCYKSFTHVELGSFAFSTLFIIN